MSNYSQAQLLADAGKLTALTVLFCLFTVFVPLFWFVTLALCPVPTLIVAKKHGFKYGLFTALASGVLLVLIVGPIEGIPLFLIIVFLGVGQGLAIGKGLRASQVVVVGMLAVVISLSLMGGLAYYVYGINLISEQVKVVEKAVELQKKLYLASGVPDSQVEAQVKSLKEMIKYFPYLLPSGILIFSCWIAFLNYWVSNQVLRRQKLEFISLPPFKDWQFPWYFSWGFVLGFAGVLFYQYSGVYRQVIQLTSLNLLFVFSISFLIQGISIIFFFFDKYRLSVLAKITFLTLALVIQFFFQGITFLGLLDTWFNFRKLPRKE